MTVVVRKRSFMWAACLVAVVVLTGAALAQIRMLTISPTSTTAIGGSRPSLIVPVRPPLISPIQP
jgi:hypothetical protein